MATPAGAAQIHKPPPPPPPPPPLTAEDILLLARSSSATLPSSVSHSALLSLLDSPSPSVPVAAYLSSLLSLISRTPPSPSLSSLIPSLLLSFLRLFRSRLLPRDPDTSRIFHLFSAHIPTVDPSHLPSLLELVTSGLSEVADPDDALPLDLLPRLLDLAIEASGEETVHPILERLLAANWSKALLLKIVSLLRDLPPLARVRVPDFLEKVFGGMKGVDLQDLPSLVYQLLLLASKGLGRRAAIGGILGFFARGLKGPPPILRQVEGTVLMHVNFAVKQDPSLGQEMLTTVRSDLGLFNHFAVAVLLSVARVRRFSESAIGVLKSAVVVSHRDYKLARDCKWLPDCLREECLETAKCVERAIMRAVNENNSGREHVVPSIVQFGFVLLEAVEGDNAKDVECSGELMGIEELGIQMLKTLFEVHDMARNEIVKQCKFRILYLKPQRCPPIIKLLGYLVQSYPYPMLEHVARLKELLDYFTFMHDKTAAALVNVILPLIKFSRDLQDYIVLVVRKAMFRPEDAVRIAATNAILDLVIWDNKSKKDGINSLQDSSSQASCSQQADIAFGTGVGLFQELSGLLRRCLSQQAGVKEIVYRGLLKLVVLDPFVAGSVFDFLWHHFLQFYNEDADSPLRIEACFQLDSGKVCLVEPLDCLLSCVSWILLLQPHCKSDHPSEFSWPCFGFSLSQENEVGRTLSGESFSNALSKIRRSLRKCTLEGQSQDPGSRSLQGEKPSFSNGVLLGIIEVFLNIVASELKKATDEEKAVLEKEIMELVEMHYSLEKKSSMNKQGSGVRRGSSRTTGQDITDKVESESKECSLVSPQKLSQARRPFFATSSIHQLLVTAVKLYNVHNSNDLGASQNQSQSSLCKTNDQCLKLISVALNTCLHHLKSITAMGSGPSNDPLKFLIYGDAIQLGQPIMQLVWLLKSVPTSARDPKKKETKVKRHIENKVDQLFLSLLCLNELFKIYSSGAHLTELIENLVSVAAPELDLEDTAEEQDFMVDNQNLRSMHLFLDKRLKPLYSGLIALELFRESEVVSELMLIIGKKLLVKLRSSHGTWAAEFCKSYTVQNPSAARSALAIAIHLIPTPNDLVAAHGMASELLKVMGSEEKDPIEISETFPVINRSTGHSVATLLVRLVDSTIMDLDWAVSRLKVIHASNHDLTGLRKNHQFGEKLPGLVLEEALYSRSEALVYLLSTFAEMNLKDSQAQQLLKVAARFYKLLALMTKLRIAPKGCKQLLPGQKFQKLAEVTCRRLTTPLYNFVALVQRNQLESAESRGVISKIRRENRSIPDLVFQIEDYERYLIQLSKLSRVNLLRHAKRSTARDFKILETKKGATVQEDPPEHELSESDPASSEDGSDGPDEGSGPAKAESPESSCGGAVGDSEADDDEEMVVKRKRAKMSKVVQDSDEEACS